MDAFLNSEKPFRFQKGWLGEQPLTYPLRSVPDSVEGKSRLVSPRVGKANGVERPTLPEDGSNYADMVNEAIEVRTMSLRGMWPSDFLARHHPRKDFDPERIPEPLQYMMDWQVDELNPRVAAASVVGDHASDVALGCLRWLLNHNHGSKMKKYDAKGHNEFLGSDLHVMENIADALKRNMEKCFEAKYYYGAARIEEFLNVNGGIFTSSPLGCPCHPTYPAGHSVASGSSSVLDDEFDLDEFFIREIFDTAYHRSMYRTLGGFHFAEDNLAGMKLAGMMARKWTN